MSADFDAQLDALTAAHKDAVDAMARMAATLDEAAAAERRLFERCLAAAGAALASLRDAIEGPSDDRRTD